MNSERPTFLFISDLDGTLLRDDATLSPFTRDTINRLLDRGMLFTVASARSVVSMQPILSGLKLSLPIIEFNGAFLSDLTTGRHRIIHSVAPAVVEGIYERIRDTGRLPIVSTFNGDKDCTCYSNLINEGMRWYIYDRIRKNDPRLCPVEDLDASFGDQVVCMTVIDRYDELEHLRRSIEDPYGDFIETHMFENRYSPGWYWLTVHDRRATKDRAAHTLIAEFGLNGVELIVFGDHDNDVKLFRIARRSIAVANATDELKSIATETIGSNDRDSVAKYLLRCWEVERDGA